MDDNIVKRAIYARLTADSTLTGMLASTSAIYDNQAPQGAQPPYVVYTKPVGLPTYTMAGRAYDSQLWQIKAVTEGPSFASAGSIVARVDALLDNQPVTLTGGTVLALQRAFDIPEYPETVDGKRFNHKGSSYRIFVI